MISKDIEIPNFIIGGTFKAATTSVFSYLKEHPEVCACSLKEPGIFSHKYKLIFEECSLSLPSLFENGKSNPNIKIFMEATVGYLEIGRIIAERIRSHLVNPKLLFILRDPVERLFSYYNFFVSSQLQIPTHINFEQFVRYCKDDLDGSVLNNKIPFRKRHLRALPAGRYSYYIREFLNYFSQNQIQILFYEDLQTDIQDFVKSICIFLDIDASFFDEYDFQRKNVTYLARNKSFHQITWYVWRKFLTRYLNHKPIIKDSLLSIYKKFNTKQIEYGQIDPALRLYLADFYLESKEDLQALIGPSVNIPWEW